MYPCYIVINVSNVTWWSIGDHLVTTWWPLIQYLKSGSGLTPIFKLRLQILKSTTMMLMLLLVLRTMCKMSIKLKQLNIPIIHKEKDVFSLLWLSLSFPSTFTEISPPIIFSLWLPQLFFTQKLNGEQSWTFSNKTSKAKTFLWKTNKAKTNNSRSLGKLQKCRQIVLQTVPSPTGSSFVEEAPPRKGRNFLLNRIT